MLAGTEVVKPDGRLSTELVLVPSGAAGTFFDRTLGFGAEALRLLGFFFRIGTGREPIAAFGPNTAVQEETSETNNLATRTWPYEYMYSKCNTCANITQR